MKRVVILLIPAMIAGCTTIPNDFKTIGKIGSANYQLTEHADDGAYKIPIKGELLSGKSATKFDYALNIDKDSVLEINFTIADSNQVAEPSQEWRAINKWLNNVEELFIAIKDLNKKVVNTTDNEAVKKIQKEIIDLSKTINKAKDEAENLLEKLGLTSDEEKNQIFQGKFIGSNQKECEKSRLACVSQWFNLKRLELIRDARSLQKERQHQLILTAYRKSGNKNLHRLHVENYDTINSGANIDLEGNLLGLTQNELEQLNMEIEQSEKASRVIKSLLKKQDVINQQIKDQLLDELKNSLKELHNNITDKLVNIEQNLEAITQHLTNSNNKEEISQKVDKMLEKIRGLQQDWKKIKKLQLDLNNLYNNIRNINPESFLSTVLNSINSIINDAKDIKVKLEKWPGTIKDLMDDAINLSILIESKLEEDLRDLKENINSEILTIKDKLECLDRCKKKIEIIKVDNETIDPIVTELDELGDETISRSLDTLLPARIALADTKLEKNDSITIRLDLFEKDRQPLNKPIQSSEYYLKIKEQGWHRKITGMPILARADSDSEDGKKWKPNVAVIAEWHNRIRFPNKHVKIWNSLDPAIGIHAASLDQGEDSIEFGFGLNVSFWDGLVTMGVGGNLNTPTDHLYYFIGSDLLKLLGNLSLNSQ